MNPTDYPQQIEKLNVDAARCNQYIEEVRAQISAIESELQLEITRARNPDGKPVFTNDTARAAAFTKSCDESDELQTLIAERCTHEFRRAEILAKLERLRLEFKLHLLDRQEQISRQISGVII
ncbi:MAG: hypothetical protein M3209_09390 [Acidobacteriota bacterium]|nr:hypothetical protein [Acidobacteriota bacterium]